MSNLPDLADFAAYETRSNVILEGVTMPGMVGEFFRRPAGERTETVGLYRHEGVEVFMAWGYADEAHCSWTAYRSEEGWTPPQPGCPSVSAVLALKTSTAHPMTHPQTIQV